MVGKMALSDAEGRAGVLEHAHEAQSKKVVDENDIRILDWLQEQ